MLYMTRIQRERFADPGEYEQYRGVYVLDKELMARAPQDMIVLHPLPRVDEIDPEIDSDPRALYFEQACGGVPVRMALIALLLGVVEETQSGRRSGLAEP
jgi:aspartate carbamoyltransferase catalytic subunit